MDNGNAQMYVEDRIEAPGAQPSPGLGTASNRAGEPTISEVSQVGTCLSTHSRHFPFPCPDFPSNFFN